MEMKEIFESMVLPALALLLTMFIRLGRQVSANTTKLDGRGENCRVRGKWISRIDRRSQDTETHAAVNQSRMDSHIENEHRNEHRKD